MNAPLPQSMTIGQLLLSRGLISQADLDKALAFQKQAKARLGAALVRLGAISEDSLLPVLADQLGMTLLDEEDITVRSEDILRTIEQTGISPAWFAEHGLIIWEG